MNTGGMEVQYNVVRSATMRAAQKDPDSYRNLAGRTAGYPACLVEASTGCRNDMICRT